MKEHNRQQTAKEEAFVGVGGRFAYGCCQAILLDLKENGFLNEIQFQYAAKKLCGERIDAPKRTSN